MSKKEKTLSERVIIFMHKRYPRPFPKEAMLAKILEKAGVSKVEAEAAMNEAYKTAEIDEIFRDGMVQYVFVQPKDRIVVIGRRQQKFFDEL